MSFIKEQCSLLSKFWRTDFGRLPLWCLLGLFISLLGGIAMGLMSPETVGAALASFQKVIESKGVIDSQGNLSVFSLLLNNWIAMLTSAAYGFLPFFFLPAISLGANGFLIGMMAAWYISNGFSMALFAALLLPHGVFELAALVLSVSCGVYLCWNINRLIIGSSNSLPMVELLENLLRVLLFLVAPLTVVAAFIEAYITPLIAALFV